MTGSVSFLVGRPPSAASVVHEVQAALTGAGVAVTLTVVDQALPAAVEDADLLVLKDLPPQVLTAVARLARATCNDAVAELRSLDKAAVVEALRAAGLPVPASRCTSDWSEVQQAAALGPVVVKPQVGTQGAGVLLLDGPAPGAPLASGPWLVQDRVSSDGLDRKLYVAGERVDGLLRRWPDRVRSTLVEPGPELAELARAPRGHWASSCAGSTSCSRPPDRSSSTSTPSPASSPSRSRPGRRGAPAGAPVGGGGGVRVVVLGTGKIACGYLAPLFRSAGWDVVLAGRTRRSSSASSAPARTACARPCRWTARRPRRRCGACAPSRSARRPSTPPSPTATWSASAWEWAPSPPSPRR
jgi:hypothetical protein